MLSNVVDYEVRSAGTEKNSRIKVTEGMIGWADLIFKMEKKHTRRIQEKYQERLLNKKVICLCIADDYQLMDRELIAIISSKIAPYLK